MAWTRAETAPWSTISYEVVVYDDDGPDGDPGTLLAAVPTSADNVPIAYTDILFSSTPIAPPAITEGSVYIGFRWDATEEQGFYYPVDTSASTPQQRIRSSSDGGATWAYTTSLGRALFVRARSTSDYVVVPEALEYTHGNTYSGLPFAGSFTRYQQVFQGSEVGARWISELRFRAAWQQEDNRLCPDLLDDLTITLSTTQKPIDGLSVTFSENVGLDETVVFDGDIWLQGRGSGNRLPLPFDIAIPLQTSFFFAGSGNLLLDINTHGGDLYSMFWFDTNEAADGVSRAYCSDLIGCPTYDTTPYAPDSKGVVTMFLVGGHSIFNDGFESGDSASWTTIVP